MKTLFVSYRINDLDRSLAFYTSLGYGEVSRVTLKEGGYLVILKFPEEPAASLKPAYCPANGSFEVGDGFDHLAIQVESLDTTVKALAEAGMEPEPNQFPGGPDGSKTAWLTDPDGYRIELVEWPPGHPDGITEADFS